MPVNCQNKIHDHEKPTHFKLDWVRYFICVVFAPIIQSIYDKIKVTSNTVTVQLNTKTLI